MIGRGTLIPDKVNGGVMTRTFINVTLGKWIRQSGVNTQIASISGKLCSEILSYN